MGVDRGSKAVMTERVPGNATRAEVLCSEHAPRRHDADESIELWFLGILAQADVGL
jgi:hypothetical protein